MKEYIERAAVEAMLENAQIITDGEYCGYCTEDVNLNSIPAADVVEVVRCDHCGRRYEENGEYFCSRTDMPCADDDFCSHGARMDKEDDNE